MANKYPKKFESRGNLTGETVGTAGISLKETGAIAESITFSGGRFLG
jgi:hypothetical protein